MEQILFVCVLFSCKAGLSYTILLLFFFFGLLNVCQVYLKLQTLHFTFPELLIKNSRAVVFVLQNISPLVRAF